MSFRVSSQALTVTFVLSMFCTLEMVHPASKEQWKRRVIYHLLTDRFAQSVDTSQPCSNLSYWCNGTWSGITRHLDYIENLGATAIWISPIVENTPGGYHGYWAKNIFEVNTHFGTEDELHDLITECHRRNIYVMADVVPNHMGYPPNCTNQVCPPEFRDDFRTLVPFNDPEHYHEFCDPTDWNNETQVEICRLAYLPDLNQTVPHVNQTLLDWIHNLTIKYRFDGYRVDTVKHVHIDFWPAYQQAAGAYCMGEVWYESSVDYLNRYQTEGNMDGLLNFHLFGGLKEVFYYSKSMTVLADYVIEEAKFKDVHALGIFADNHDVRRFLNETGHNITLFKNALTYIMFGQGIPVIYYGSEQAFAGGNDPHCRESLWPQYDQGSEMYQFISSSLSFRKDHVIFIAGSQHQELYADRDALIFARASGDLIVAITNMGPTKSSVKHFSMEPEGKAFANIANASDVIVVRNGILSVSLYNGQPKVYYVTTQQPAANHGNTVRGSSPLLYVAFTVLFCVFLNIYNVDKRDVTIDTRHSAVYDVSGGNDAVVEARAL